MADDRLQRRADRLAARVQALAAALHASGAPEEAAAELLSLASATVLQALSLELLAREPALRSLEARNSANGRAWSPVGSVQ